MQWAFLVDANLEPQVSAALAEAGFRAEHVDDRLGEGADDEADVLPYARSEELIIITADVKNFRPIPDEDHEGVFLLNDQQAPPSAVAEAVLEVVEQYRDPSNLDGKTEHLDKWL